MKLDKKFTVEYKVGIVSSLSASIIWVILISLWSLIAANIVSLWHSEVVLFWQYLVAGISIGAMLVGSIQFYRNNSNKFKPRFPSLSMDYIYKEIETELHFKTRENIAYSSNYNISALKEISEMKRSHNWTGDYISSPILESAHNHKVELCKDASPLTTAKIIFDVPLEKNQPTTFKLKYELGDSSKIMQPMIGHLVRNPTERIILRLCVPNDMVKGVKRCVYADSFAQINLSQPQIIHCKIIGNNDVYEWVIDNPSLLYYYRISWEFT